MVKLHSSWSGIAAPHESTEHVAETEPSRWSRTMLFALNRQKHIYGGTVPQAEVDKRRAKNRAARRSRRINRGTR